MSDTTVDDRTKAEGSLAPSLEGLLLEQVNDWMRGERSLSRSTSTANRRSATGRTFSSS